MSRNAAHVLRLLLAWRGALAAARPPCADDKAPWRPIIGRRYLNTHKVHDLFINYIDHERPHLFARPSPNSMIDAMFDFLPSDNHMRFWWSVLDHNNVLLLCDMGTYELCVCNPMTRRWTLIPWAWWPVGGIYLAFDPAMSPQDKVLVIPVIPGPEELTRRADEKGRIEKPPSLGPPYVNEDNDTCRLMESEWPPTPWTLNVFSLETSEWQERTFAGQGQPAGTVRDMLVDRVEPTYGGPRQCYAVYHQGVLYVHCRGSFVLRLTLSNGTYQVIKAPTYNEEKRQVKPYLGISEKGVYFGVIEEAGQMEWILRHEDGLSHCGQHIRKYVDAATTLPKERYEWDSDNDDFFTIRFGADGDWEVVYLTADMFEVVAYHLSDSKIQYLGYSRPKSYYCNWTNGIYDSFVYTPRMVGELKKECTVSHVED
ncbi:hypothetical protein VPH35_108611 [Triticum aestivum]